MLSHHQLQSIQKSLTLKTLPAVSEKLIGGDINDVYLLDFDKNNKVVVKVNQKERFPEMLAKEKEALIYLNKHSPLNYAAPAFQFEDSQYQYLGLNYVEKGSSSSKGQLKLGEGLAKQHQQTSNYFGWETDNYIGSLPQINTKKDNWSDFYSVNRLLFQTKIAFDSKKINQPFLTKMDRFCNYLDQLYPKEAPSLLHGDLWGGNYFIDKNENPFIYDPAVYYGHREIDIAMTQLFGGFDTTFISAYNKIYPLEKGWQERIKYGQLYPNLVHLNLFGVAYLHNIKSIIDYF